VRSIIGTKSPGFCSFLIWLTVFRLDGERRLAACFTGIVARNVGRVHWSSLMGDGRQSAGPNLSGWMYPAK